HAEGETHPPALSCAPGRVAPRAQAGRDLVTATAGAQPSTGQLVDTWRVWAPDKAPWIWSIRGTSGGRDAPGDRHPLSVLVLMEEGDASQQMLTAARSWGGPVHSVRADAAERYAPDAIAAILQRAAEELDVAAVF